MLRLLEEKVKYRVNEISRFTCGLRTNREGRRHRVDCGSMCLLHKVEISI
jgi:hypothetical protein